MNKYLFKFLGLFILIILLEGIFFIQPVEAEGGLVLEKLNECSIQYGSDNCVIELKLNNNTGKVLQGKSFLHIDYSNTNHIDGDICKSGSFDGEGITAQFSTSSTGTNWLDFSDSWTDGTTIVSGFSILQNESHPRLRLKTSVNLCPGNYDFKLTVQGTSPTGEVYRGVVIGGQGGGLTAARKGIVAGAATSTEVTGKEGQAIVPNKITGINSPGIVEGASSTQQEPIIGGNASSTSSSKGENLNWNSMLMASLADSLRNFLRGNSLNNLFFWILIGSLGFLLYLLSIIRKPSAIFKVLGIAGIWFMFISFFLLPLPMVNQFRMSWPKFIVYPVGIIFAISGIIIIFESLKKISFRVAFGPAEPTKLSTSGIYGVVRHPLYLGFVSLFFGLCFMFRSFPALIFLPLVVLFLWILSLFEEKELLGIYGNAYRLYKTKVRWRLIPKII